MKYLSRCTLIALLMGLLAVPALSFAQTYTIGVESISYYPHYDNDKGEYKGFARDILDAFAAEKGYTFIYKPVPVARLFQEFLAGKFDFKYPDNAYWSADMKEGKNVIYSEPVVSYIDGVMVLPGNKGMGIDALKTLGTIRGFTAWTYMDLIKEGKVKIRENNGFIPLLEMTMKGRVDGAYVSIDVARWQLAEVLGKPGGLVFDSDLPYTKSAYFLSTIKEPEVMKEFNQFLVDKKELVDGLKEKYKVDVDLENF